MGRRCRREGVARVWSNSLGRYDRQAPSTFSCLNNKQQVRAPQIGCKVAPVNRHYVLNRCFHLLTYSATYPPSGEITSAAI